MDRLLVLRLRSHGVAAEAWLNGALVTIMVVYLPHWVGSFDDRRYLLNK